MPASVTIIPETPQHCWWHSSSDGGSPAVSVASLHWLRMGVHSPWLGSGGELRLDLAKPSETQRVGLLARGVTSTCLTQCWTVLQLWGERGADEVPQDGQGESPGWGDTWYRSRPPQPGKPLPSINATLVRDMMEQPGRVEGNLVPTCCWREGTMSCAQGDVLP